MKVCFSLKRLDVILVFHLYAKIKKEFLMKRGLGVGFTDVHRGAAVLRGHCRLPAQHPAQAPGGGRGPDPEIQPPGFSLIDSFVYVNAALCSH